MEKENRVALEKAGSLKDELCELRKMSSDDNNVGTIPTTRDYNPFFTIYCC